MTTEKKGIFERIQVAKAVHAIFQYVKKKDTKGDSLLSEGQDIHLQITCKKIAGDRKTIKIPLPTSLWKESSDACLLVKDLDKKKRDFTPTVTHFKELLEKKGVDVISEVIPLKALKLEYQPFEAKRNLSNMYDYFLADERIVRLLPTLLGKSFYGRKKVPISVDLQMMDLKGEIERALGCTRLMLSERGSSSQVTIAHTAMSEEQAVENIMAADQRLVDGIPGGATNVRNIHVKVQDSPALPIYISTDSANDVVLPARKRKRENEEPEEISTLLNEKVTVSPEGEIHFYNMAGEPVKDPEEEAPKKRKPRRSKGGKGNPDVSTKKEQRTAVKETVEKEKTAKKINKLLRAKNADKTKTAKKMSSAKLLQKKTSAKSAKSKAKPKAKKLKTR